MVTVAIDAMGGDFGPEPIINGVLEANKSAKFNAVLVGDKTEIEKYLPSKIPANISIMESTDVIDMHESATDALKRKESSIFKAVDLVRNKEADAIVSAGHSGATMSLATLRIGRLPGILRPAIATLMPTATGGRTLVLDVGANVDSKPEHLLQFAVMGKAYAMDVLNHELPRVGLLANGEEASKGNDVVKETHKALAALEGFNFIGNIEGNDIFNGSVDVVVCDGFVGNVLLKTSEGVAEAIRGFLKKSIKESLLAILGSTFMLGAFKSLKKQIDYAEYGGAPLLGVNGCAIVSHGKSNAKAIKNAIFQAIRFVESGVNEDIEKFNERYHTKKD
jgi:glycerol-3-phosphate acyltransferase PlsX